MRKETRRRRETIIKAENFHSQRSLLIISDKKSSRALEDDRIQTVKLKQQLFGVCFFALLSCSLAAITQPPPTSSTLTASRGTTVTINPKLRKALLEALSNFDGEDSTESDEETTTASSGEEIDGVTNNPSFIKVHSFAIDGDKSDENEIIKTIIISRPRTTLTPPKQSYTKSDEFNNGKTIDPINSFHSKSDNVVQARSVETRIVVDEIDKKEEKLKKKASEKSITKPVTPQTTTTTLPPPVTNSDGENIEKVDKDDVKIFQAPLLAAFTVQQDINGQPKNVISLFKNPQNDKKIVNMEFRPSQPLSSSDTTAAPTLATIASTTSNQVTSSSAPQQQLISVYEQKQRLLEEQIRILQLRQREQEEIIRRHQILEQQQQQRLRFEEEQRRQRFEQEQFVLRQQQQVVNQPQTAALVAPPSPNVNVQFIPSIPLGHTVGISVEQQLPFKGPFEFNPDKPELQKPFSQRQQQFNFNQFQKQQQLQSPFIQKQEVKQISQLPTNLELPVKVATEFNTFSSLPTNLELPQKPFQTFNSAPLAVLPSLTDIIPQSEARNRVFRNDALQTGNFGQNVEFQPQQIVPVYDAQLQNLFAQSGINQRSAEDFRIISKVLALNHGVPSNLLFNSGRFQ
ncbi:hypothetical protein PVAND_001957 [Polypedilum vanderplanki]|uniref:Uncharacterized protein n=1 Tax=Polypedilum vanderplanki TaxID=319348 RepID=A0A9J6BPJ3_POLVA|nr:hypothetical protein PVAND_001957 [Polypedilum vanderplanki]